MCGRAQVTLTDDDVAAASHVPKERFEEWQAFRPSYNLQPGSFVPVMYEPRNGGANEGESGGATDGAAGVNGRVVRMMRWGVIPHYHKAGEKLDFFMAFNARSETLLEKPTWSHLVTRARRAVIFIDSFYEWLDMPAKSLGPGRSTPKQPYNIRRSDSKPLAIAALYNVSPSVIDQANDQAMFSVAMVTTRNSKRMGWLHDRCPAFLLDATAIDAWLTGPGPQTKNPAIFKSHIKKVIQPSEDPLLIWEPVSPEIGKMSFQGPHCVARVPPAPFAARLDGSSPSIHSAAASPIGKLFEKFASPARSAGGSKAAAFAGPTLEEPDRKRKKAAAEDGGA